MKPSIITLLTDFGARDYFVAAMKAVILSINPAARIVDITHEISPQDVHAGAFNLLAVYKDFPSGTIHLSVVDPGVGSDRRAIVIECADRFFVGPDNGLFSWMCQREGKWRARQITNEKFFGHPVSRTFHGRDVFAPAAATLSNGVNPVEFGPVVHSIVELESLVPKELDDGTIEASIIHIDRFGNCITNISAEQLGSGGAKLMVNDIEVTSLRSFFSEASSKNDELFMILGSAGFIEIAARNASAASILKVQRGQTVLLINDQPH